MILSHTKYDIKLQWRLQPLSSTRSYPKPHSQNFDRWTVLLVTAPFTEHHNLIIYFRVGAGLKILLQVWMSCGSFLVLMKVLHVYFDLRQSHLKKIETSHFIFFILIMSFYEISEFSNRDNIKLRITICIHNSRITALKIISISVDT